MYLGLEMLSLCCYCWVIWCCGSVGVPCCCCGGGSGLSTKRKKKKEKKDTKF